jgi:RNA polymerase sigma-70 factor (ECF subfamily)
MRKTASGSQESLERLVRRHANGLLTFIERTVGDYHRSEELFQEVVLAVWTHRRQYDYPQPFKPWLYKIALNRCRLNYRTAMPRVMSLPDEEAAVARDPLPVDAAIWVETARVLKEAVRRLPGQQRAVVVLRIWNGMSYREIAEIVGAAEATVRSYMVHALSSLRQHLEPRLR